MKELSNQSTPFNSTRQTDNNGREFWSARDLQKPLGYVEWRKFEDAIQRAEIACKNSGSEPSDHFVIAAKPIKGGKGSVQNVQDYHLTRYGCYLTAMNGDPRKPEIAAAQAYFAIKTREAELGVAQGIELDFWTLAQNPQIRRQKIETNEDIMLALRKETECLKYIEQRCNPELSRRRGRRNTPRVVTTECPIQTTQLMLSFDQDIA